MAATDAKILPKAHHFLLSKQGKAPTDGRNSVSAASCPKAVGIVPNSSRQVSSHLFEPKVSSRLVKHRLRGPA